MLDPTGHVLEARATVRLYKDLVDQRSAWHQRIAATLFHQGVPAGVSAAKPAGRAAAAEADLSPAGRQAVEAGLRHVDRLTAELDAVGHLRAASWPAPSRHGSRSSLYGCQAAGLGRSRRTCSGVKVRCQNTQARRPCRISRASAGGGMARTGHWAWARQ